MSKPLEIWVLRNSRGHTLGSIHESPAKALNRLADLIHDEYAHNKQLEWLDYKPVLLREVVHE